MLPRPIAPALLAVLLPHALFAQWSTNPATNFAVADGPGEQALPKLAARGDGGCYVAWFDSASGSYAVRMQRLDAAGVEQWPHGGILVSGHPQSTSLVDWDLICDSSGAAVLTFTDTRAGGDLDVYAYRVDAAGAMQWGNNGVTLTNDGDYEANPRVVESSFGNFVFAWSRGFNAGGGSLEVQKLDIAGNPLFGSTPLSIPADPGATPGFHALVASDADGFILAWMRDISFRGNRYIYAQKFDLAGAPLWGASPLSLFDGNSLPIAHQLKLQSDDAGGAVLCWHFTPLNVFSTRIQHVAANGTEMFLHNGIDVSAEANVSKLDPAFFFAPSSGETFVAFNVRNPTQSQWGVSVQKLDSTGAVAWGPDGIRVEPLDAVNESAQRIVPFGDGAMVFYLQQPGATPPASIRAVRMKGNGQIAWGAPAIPVSNAVAEKLWPVVRVNASGVAQIAWTDRRVDSGDVLVQNLNPNGTLGADLAAVTAYGCGVNPTGSMAVSGSAAIGGHLTFALDNPLGTQSPAQSFVFLALSFGAAPGYPCGVALPGFGMAGNGTAGELLLDFGLLAGPALPVVPWLGTGQPATLGLDVPLDANLAGALLHAQGAIVDLAPGAIAPIGMTDAARIRIAF
ncbi:MAG: hypothetical protein U1F36_04865 [Planctomycetota bacterium]